MPVILDRPEDIETWLTAPWDEARSLQRPLPDDRLVLLAQATDDRPEARSDSNYPSKML